MSGQVKDAIVYGTAEEAGLRAFVEALTGGTIVRMERQDRWRPAWFADVETETGLLKLHLRGDRGGDVAIFPDLEREAKVMRVLGEHGVPVPRIHGYCQDPPCIVMDAIAGTRDMKLAGSDEARASIGREFMKAMATMHMAPLEPFVAQGVHRPETPKDIALVGLEAYLPLYRRTKAKPEPLLEFAIGWMQRNVPPGRAQASFVQFDCGQFHFDAGKLTGLYDFEFSMIADPMVDFATMGMRDSVEPLGTPLAELIRHYEEYTGKPVDHYAIDYYVLQFATLGTMQFTGTVADPKPNDVHSVYIEWDLSLRQCILLALSKLAGVAADPLPPFRETASPHHAIIAKIADTVAQLPLPDAIAQTTKRQVDDLLEWLTCADIYGPEIAARDLADISVLLGRSFDDMASAEAALELYVQEAPPSADAALIRLFLAMEGRRMQTFGQTRLGTSARHVALLPTR